MPGTSAELLPLASLGDVCGYRRIYAIGLAVFTRAVSSGLAFALLIGRINGIGHRETAGFVALELIGAAVVGALLVRQNSLSLPMLPVHMFKRPLFALSVATSACSSVAQGIVFVLAAGFSALAAILSVLRLLGVIRLARGVHRADSVMPPARGDITRLRSPR